MALTLVSRTARRVGIACTATDTVYFYPDEGYQAFTTNAGHSARIKPPRGVWEVTIDGDNLQDASPTLTSRRVTPTDGRIRFTRYYTGNESILIRPTEQGATCTVVLEEAPPLRKCVLARLAVATWR
nr:MAG TPA_asm: hypothetical protein [Caudoviricetes sp.]